MNIRLPIQLAYSLLFFSFVFLVVLPKQVLASFEFIKNTQPLILPELLNWDDVGVQGPQILIENGIYKMWYDGAGHIYPGWEIGYAESINGTDFQYRKTTPIMEYSPPQEKYMSHPAIVHVQPNLYQLWYTSYNDSLHFATRYATSTDGQTWVKYPNIVLDGTPGSWDSGGSARGRSVVYRDGVYHMWYAAQDAANLWNSWKIGYATSSDGIHWQKENGGQPVLTQTAPWEGYVVAYPNVFLKDGVYHMFYGTSNEDTTVDIVYAYSKDGIIWIKPSNMNPVLTRSYPWENRNLSSPFVLIDGDQLKMWYGAYSVNNNVGIWQIGYATAAASTLPTPNPDQIPTAALTPTPTPTATSTPTPAPTPTPMPKKVIIIPGMGGSWNTEALLSCSPNYTGSNPWIITPTFGTDVYQPLFDTLVQSKYIPYFFTYNWRKIIPQNGLALTSYINNLTIPGEKVSAVAHSMGGLVGREYLGTTTNNTNKLDKLLTVGSPHDGAVGAYPSWSAGEIWTDNMLIRIAMTTIIETCGKLHGKTNRDVVRTLMPSFGNLLPRFPYLIDSKTGEFRTPTDSLNTWNPNSLSPLLNGTSIQTISGSGNETLASLRVKNPTMGDLKYPIWLDGKPVKSSYSTLGDGTVLTQSEIIADIPNITLPTDHSGLMNSTQGTSAITTFLGTQGTQIPSVSQIQSALMVIGHPASVWITDPSWQVRKDVQGMVGFVNPKKGSYRLLITPKSETTRFIVAQFLPNDRTLWKEYTLEGKFPKIQTLIFDPVNPMEDPLQ